MRKNIKVIIGIVIGMVLVSGISVYATLSFTAGDIEYTKSGTNTKISVASALNELYQNKKETTDNVQSITQNGSVQLDKYYKNLNVNVPIPAGYVAPSGTKTISTKANNIDVKNYQYADTTGMYTAEEYNNYGNSQYIAGSNANANAVGYKAGIYTRTNNSKHVVNFECGFRPSTILIKTQNNSEVNQATCVFDQRQNSSKSFKINFLNNTITSYSFRDNSYTNSYIYDVTNTGFQFQFIDNSSNTSNMTIIQWIAFK